MLEINKRLSSIRFSVNEMNSIKNEGLLCFIKHYILID